MDVNKVKSRVSYLKGLIDGMVGRIENYAVAEAVLREANEVEKSIIEELDSYKPEKSYTVKTVFPPGMLDGGCKDEAPRVGEKIEESGLPKANEPWMPTPVIAEKPSNPVTFRDHRKPPRELGG